MQALLDKEFLNLLDEVFNFMDGKVPHLNLAITEPTLACSMT